ncbi:hypothetical protein E2C01_066846 [Portunus trituberculatus]|uniref:Uncharacterized protein n=1 Tax=Portunus trituberculatus TaxID=210409 RepID=A0A5B7HS24_PORTR|nr:hypothetical protein [Portunus trituberculatus]
MSQIFNFSIYQLDTTFQTTIYTLFFNDILRWLDGLVEALLELSLETQAFVTTAHGHGSTASPDGRRTKQGRVGRYDESQLIGKCCISQDAGRSQDLCSSAPG